MYTILRNMYKEGKSLNLTRYDTGVKTAILKRCEPLTEMNVVRGDYIVYTNNTELILFRVISSQDTWFAVEHEGKEIIVFYEYDINHKLFCTSINIQKRCYLKLSNAYKKLTDLLIPAQITNVV